MIFSLKVKVNSKTPQIWFTIKNRLNNISKLKDYQIISLSTKQIKVELNYIIPVQYFKEVLQKHSVFLYKKPDEWSLTLSQSTK